MLSSQNTITQLLYELEYSKVYTGSIKRLDTGTRKFEHLIPLGTNSSLSISPPSSPLQPSNSQSCNLGKSPSRLSHHLRDDRMVGDGLFSRTVTQMEEQITELRHIFDGTDPMQIRLIAVTKIQATFRAHWARKKYRAYQKSFQDWRFGRSKRLLRVLEAMLSRAARIETCIRKMGVMRDYHLTVSIFSRWKHICKQSAPFRLSIRTAAEEKYVQVMFGLKARAFLALKDGTLGIDSHKYIRKQRRKMIDRAKAKIQSNMKQSNLNLLISEEEVRRAVHREIVSSSLMQREMRNKMLIFKSLKNLYSESIAHGKMAYSHFFKKYVGKCFYAWSDWVYQIGTGLERKRWIGPRKYEVRYNQKLVEHFSRTRLKKMTIRPWKRYTQISRNVNRMYMKQLTRFVRNHLLSWRHLTTKYIHLRKLTIANWVDYSSVVISPPFFAWKQYASTATIRRMQQDSLANAYIRWKNRQKHIKILRAWRHQSLYGGIEGMYSRTTISKSLGEQKSMCASLQKLLSKQMVDLEECKDMVHKETTLRKKMEDRVAERDIEIEVLRLKIHHLDMELKRLHGLIDAMTIINPKQIEYIRNIQPEFEFRTRKLQPSLEVASDAELYNLDTKAPKMRKDIPATQNQNLSNSSKSSQSSRSSSNRADSPANPPLVPQQTPLSLDDRRLLVRTKWLLKRLFNSPEVADRGGKAEKRKKLQYFTALNEVEEDDDEHNSQNAEISLNQVLAETADRKEIIFVLSILSFLKDGNTKCLGPKDCRSWTEELLQSVGRNPDIVSSILGQSINDPLKRSSSPDGFIDMESWRDILIHLRTHYPVGLISPSVQSVDNFDPHHIGTLNRVKSMKAELQEVIRYKTEKRGTSTAGKILTSSIALSNEAILEEPDDRNWNAINIYSQNLPSELGRTNHEILHEDLSVYDSVSLNSVHPTTGILLSPDLGFDEEFRLMSD